MPDLPMDLDPAVQSALRDLMQEDYGLLLDTFSQDAIKRLAQLRVSLEAGDWEGFRQTVHSFKGSCGNMGAMVLQQACEQAEQAASEPDATEARRSYERIQQAFERLAPLLGI